MPIAIHSVTGVVSDAQIAACAKQAGFSGQDLTIAVAVALAESSGRADVVNYLGCTGLWQIYVRVWHKQFPLWSTSWLKVPSNNAIAAREVYKRQGWRAWSTYSSGSYKRFMNRAATGVSKAGGVAPVGGLNSSPGAFTDDGSTGGTAPSFANLTNPQTYKNVALIIIGILCVWLSIQTVTAEPALKVAGLALNFVPGGSVAKGVVKSTVKGTVKSAVKTGVKAASK